MSDRHQAQPPQPVAQPLPPERLYRACPAANLTFASTAELAPVEHGIGQARADAAVRFALGMKHGGYNLFALGPAGTGKYDFVREAVEKAAAAWPVPPDWCYVHNFAEAHRPRALRLPAGRGRLLRDQMDRLIEELRLAIPGAFESEEYQARRTVIQERHKEKQEHDFGALQERARADNVAIIRTPMGLALAPIRDGEVLSPQEFEQLPADEKQRRQQASERVQKELAAFLKEVPKVERAQRDEMRDLNRETTSFAAGHLIDEIKARWDGFAKVQAHLEAIRQDVLENVEEFLPKEPQGPQIVIGGSDRQGGIGAEPFRRYQINVVVDNAALAGADGGAGGEAAGGAPVIYEDHPTLANLVGRVEHMAQFGALVTDFLLIKGGALHRANGGCLILDAHKVLANGFSWEMLKRTLRSSCIRIESAAEALGWSQTMTLEPQPIPLEVKVVLIGEPMVYYMLSQYDPEFSELFRVPADFDTQMDRSDGATALYARFIATLGRSVDARPLDAGGVARVIEHASRLAGDQEKLTTHVDTLEDLLREADYWAGEAGAPLIGRVHVQQAIDARTFRSDRLRERVQEEITRGTLLIETAGARVGQINGLAVIQLNSFSFGRPSRISCRVRLGKGEVVDIEREVAMGGPIHAKGVLILSSFLSSRYAREQPLSLSATLVFEQSYSGIEGDSASSTELYCLLSALSGIPIRQSFAVTGSVDQQGRVQAIGGVNEKIEGFFDICMARGLNGDEGVLIPEANVKHLMLRHDVVEACAQGRFRMFPVATIDQGIEILTGVPAGTADDHGEYPLGTVNRAVANRLAEFTRKAVSFAAAAETAKRRRRKSKNNDEGPGS